MPKKIAILGSTGSIGTQTLDVIAHHPDLFQVEAIAAGNNIALLIEQIRRFQPKIASISTKMLADEVRLHVPSTTKIVYGEQGLLEVAACGAEFVMSALVGSSGLAPTLAAIEAGKQIGLANKETLVTAGHLVMDAVKKKGVKLVPVDSEHSAIFQCLNGEAGAEANKIIITASGGSFRDKSRAELADVSVEDALKHPNWAMGAKITIDSATMVNKGFEVIEAHWLFGLAYEQIDVVIHPQSVIHSFVEFVDGSVMAQLGVPDMRVPIQYALTYPHRLPSPANRLDLLQYGKLDFFPMSEQRYPCLKMARQAGTAGGTMPVVFNAANEVAVARFLAGDIRFLQIESLIEHLLSQHESTKNPSLEQIFEIDRLTRSQAAQI